MKLFSSDKTTKLHIEQGIIHEAEDYINFEFITHMNTWYQS